MLLQASCSSIEISSINGTPHAVGSEASGIILLLLLVGTLTAQSAPSQADQIAQLRQQVADAKGSADNAWMHEFLKANL